MNSVVKGELKAYIDPLTPDEHEALTSRTRPTVAKPNAVT